MPYRLLDYQWDRPKLASYKSLLDYLREQYVFGIERGETGQFCISELCDRYYSVDFTAEQLMALAAEISALAIEVGTSGPRADTEHTQQ